MEQQSNLKMKGDDSMNRTSKISVDADMDGVVDATENLTEQADRYAERLAVQLRKGFLAYCVLKVCSHEPKYTSDIILELKQAELVVVEGTIYPLLSRLQKDGLLEHQWQESEQGPPRKYYQTTDFGRGVTSRVAKKITELNDALNKL